MFGAKPLDVAAVSSVVPLYFLFIFLIACIIINTAAPESHVGL